MIVIGRVEGLGGLELTWFLDNLVNLVFILAGFSFGFVIIVGRRILVFYLVF